MRDPAPYQPGSFFINGKKVVDKYMGEFYLLLSKLRKETPMTLIKITSHFDSMKEAQAWAKKMTNLRKGGSRLYIQTDKLKMRHYVWRTITQADKEFPCLINEKDGLLRSIWKVVGKDAVSYRTLKLDSLNLVEVRG